MEVKRSTYLVTIIIQKSTIVETGRLLGAYDIILYSKMLRVNLTFSIKTEGTFLKYFTMKSSALFTLSRFTLSRNLRYHLLPVLYKQSTYASQ